MLNVVALARLAISDVRGAMALSPFERVRLRTDAQRLQDHVAMLEEQMRIKDARMARIEPRKRPHYTPQERLQILLLRSANGWSLARTAREFLVCQETIKHWMEALKDGKQGPLLPRLAPVNRFPDYVRNVIVMLKATQPSMSCQRIADSLCRIALHISDRTVRRMLREAPTPSLAAVRNDALSGSETRHAARTVTAREPGHVWNIDITVMPIFGGFWLPWLPYALPDRWPFCWHIVVVLDHFSRAVVCATAFPSKPRADDVCRVLDYAVRCAGGAPKHIVSDQGLQFRDAYKGWCAMHDVEPRFGAIGKHGSIALIERFMRTLKSEGLRRILAPLQVGAMNRELALFCRWYNVHRPHRALRGASPAEIRDERMPAHRVLGYETRPRHPLRGKLAQRRRIQKVESVGKLELVVSHLEGRKHLPVLELRRAA